MINDKLKGIMKRHGYSNIDVKVLSSIPETESFVRDIDNFELMFITLITDSHPSISELGRLAVLYSKRQEEDKKTRYQWAYREFTKVNPEDVKRFQEYAKLRID